jgi:hypothetical protein
MATATVSDTTTVMGADMAAGTKGPAAEALVMATLAMDMVINMLFM